jgi:hypothetical protein
MGLATYRVYVVCGLNRPFLTLLVAVAFAAPVKAAETTDKTRCSEFVETSNVYDRASNASNFAKLQEYYLFMGNVMDGLDIDHIQSGSPGIMASLSDDGRLNLVAAAAVQCRNHQNMTIWNSAAFAYRATRDLEMQFGTAK